MAVCGVVLVAAIVPVLPAGVEIRQNTSVSLTDGVVLIPHHSGKPLPLYYKYVSCEYGRVSGRHSALQAA